jgi:predicted nucleic acid-binding Zn ribbon protein
MPVYTYRREDGTTFDFRQKFLDDPLKVDPETGQHVVRVIQPAGVIFKGSGFYVNDSKSASHATSAPPKVDKAESKTETKAEKPASKPAESASTSTPATAAAD